MQNKERLNQLFILTSDVGLLAFALMMSMGAFSQETKKKIKENQNYKCGDCGRKEKYLPVHHKLPQSLGGSDDISNAVALCGSCHLKWDNLAMLERIIFPGIPISEAKPSQLKAKK